jgi:hypothetical protein
VRRLSRLLLVVALVATTAAAAQANNRAGAASRRTGERVALILVAERAEPSRVADGERREASDRDGKRSSLLLLAVLVAAWCAANTWRRTARTAQRSARADAGGTHHFGRAPPGTLPVTV